MTDFRTASGRVFPIVVDNSMRETLNRCQKAAYWAYERGLRPVGPVSIDLHAGSAFAKGLEAARRAYLSVQTSALDAVDIGVEVAFEAYGDYVQAPTKFPSAKTRARIGGAIAAYFANAKNLKPEEVEMLRAVIVEMDQPKGSKP